MHKGTKLLDQARGLLISDAIKTVESSTLRSANSSFLTTLEEFGEVEVVSDDINLSLSGLWRQAAARDHIKLVAGVGEASADKFWQKNLKIRKDGENLATAKLSSQCPAKVQDDTGLFIELFSKFGVDILSRDDQNEGVDLFESFFSERLIEKLGAISLSDGRMLSYGTSIACDSTMQDDKAAEPKTVKRFLELSGAGKLPIRIVEHLSRDIDRTEYIQGDVAVKSRKVIPHVLKALDQVVS